MLVLVVPALFAVMLTTVFGSRRDGGLRHAFVETIVFGFAFVAVTTELFSAVGLLNLKLVAATWLFAFAAFVFLNRRTLKSSASAAAERLRGRIAETPPLAFVPAIVIVFVTFLLSVTSPPNNYDSMTYHMARVAHWLQNGSVAFFPTNVLRQIYQPPLAEYAILHLQVLAGNDLFANFVQWPCFIATGAVASLIVRESGGGRRAQIFSFVFCLTIPAALVQASSTQNDIIVAFLAAAFFYYFQRAVRTDKRYEFVLAGCALGLAILSKGTAYLACCPIGIYFVVARFCDLEPPRRSRFVVHVALVLLIAAAFNLPQYSRNQSMFGAPVSTAGEEVANKRLTPSIFVANIARNLSLHLGTSVASVDKGTERLYRAAFGKELDNRDSTWLDNEFKITFSSHEDSTGNLLHLLLVLAALGAAPFVLRGRYSMALPLSIVAGFLLLSLLLKWQLWGSRLQLPFFVLGAALVALVGERFSKRPLIPLGFATFALALPFLWTATPRRVFDGPRLALFDPRQKQVFRNLPDLEPYYNDAAAYVNAQHPAEVGLFLDYNDFEYPLWTLLKKDVAGAPEIRHVGVANVSKKLNSSAPPPEYVITMREERRIDGYDYDVAWIRWPVAVLKRRNQP